LAAGDDAVQMRMKQQILSPSVQDRRDADLRTEPLWIGAQCQECRRRSPEQQIVQQTLVVQYQRVQQSG
jgi:heterodisulfide reductase subunit C